MLVLTLIHAFTVHLRVFIFNSLFLHLFVYNSYLSLFEITVHNYWRNVFINSFICLCVFILIENLFILPDILEFIRLFTNSLICMYSIHYFSFINLFISSMDKRWTVNKWLKTVFVISFSKLWLQIKIPLFSTNDPCFFKSLYRFGLFAIFLLISLHLIISTHMSRAG